MRILVAEDEGALRHAIEQLMTSWGHEVTGVADGVAALRAIGSQPWDLVLTDLRMPGIDGLGVIREIARVNSNADCVVLSGWSSVESAVEAMRAGALDYLTKPLDADRLYRTVERVAERRTMMRRLEEAEAASMTDQLTGLANYGALHRTLDEMLGPEGPSEIAVAIVDIDNFKLLNDTLGHLRCDGILREAGQAIKNSIEPGDIAGRLSSDDFMVIMPNTGTARAAETLERIRATVEQIDVESASGLSIPLTISVGVGVTSNDGRDKPQLLRAVEMATHEAKRKGGNAITLRGPDSLPHVSVRAYSALHGLVQALDARDSYTRLHSEQATRQALRVAEVTGFTPEEIREIEIAGPIHDLGKIVIPDSILRKPGALTPDEWEQMRAHSSVGAVIAASLPDFENMVGIVRHHHEQWSGGGYPAGLAGEQIARVVRVFSLGDAFSAMVTDRPYRRALGMEKALIEIEKGAGTQFDPDLARTFLQLSWDDHLALTA